MTTHKLSSCIILLCTLMFLFQTNGVLAATAQLRFVPVDSENPGNISLVLDHAEKIAGFKLIITYDHSLLTFIKAKKAKATSSFMHVVNDKNPGKIIIVMASAKGISGDDLPLLYLEFTITEKTTGKARTISVSQVQLMDENLKEIKGNHPEYIF